MHYLGSYEHFSFESIKDFPGLDELKASGLLEGQARTDLLPLSRREPEDPLEEGDDGSQAIFPDEEKAEENSPSAEIIDLQS